MALSAKKRTVALAALALASGIGAAWQAYRIQQIQRFNQAISDGKTPTTDTQSFEANSPPPTVAKSGRYQDATLLFLQLLENNATKIRGA